MSGASCTHYFWGGTSEGGWGLSCLSCDILYNWYRLMCYWKKLIKPSQKMFNGFHYKHYEPSTLNNKKVVCFGTYSIWIYWLKNDVTYNQIRWSILCALHLTHPKCTHTAVKTHLEQWAAIYAAAPGEQLGVRCLTQGHLVVVLRVERAQYIYSLHLQFLPDRESNLQPINYMSNSLTLGHDFPENIHFNKPPIEGNQLPVETNRIH